jgi:competence protein ComQ
MSQSGQGDEIRSVIDDLLTAWPRAPGLSRLAKEALAGSSRGFYPSGECQPFTLLPLTVCRSLSGEWKRAVPLGASFELFKAAAEVFDDVEDADSSESLSAKYGQPIAINTGTALLILAERALIQLANAGVDIQVSIRAMGIVNSCYSAACEGQHLDLSRFSKQRMPEKAYLRMVALKTASTLECACGTGALLAMGSQKLVGLFEKFGNNLGMASQIANDILGITSGADLAKRKISLPIIFALNQTEGVISDNIKDSFLGRPGTAGSSPRELKDILFNVGAMHYARVMMECYKQRASAVLRRIALEGVDVAPFEVLLE